MKILNFCIIIFIHTLSFSQTTEQDKVKATIQQFFEGFHKQDSIMILQTVHKDIKMQSIAKNREGVTVLNTSDFSSFLKSIVSIPKEKTFRETILEYSIQVDGHMAHIWTPYNFYFDGNFSHCGVNSFQLFKEKGQWKIIYLIDTRRKKCNYDKFNHLKD
ncbi:nuclear transport factor 2 family protein [Psychroserpens damuponensis]|uniref:nuclear transport factor 2 family protein n=1 Tax=Psychroserpens damuponensis TaxID=943936 RepID=UPI00058C6E9F|nr:nuclear transport factor 2 family protein [Psychroserpens damuponensis]